MQLQLTKTNLNADLTQVDFYDFVSHADLGSTRGEGASSWGWTSPEGREFVAIAQSDGAAFAEVTKEGKLVYLGRLPQYSSVSIWREMKGYKNYLVIGSEATNHGVQIFDFRKVCAPLSAEHARQTAPVAKIADVCLLSYSSSPSTPPSRSSSATPVI